VKSGFLFLKYLYGNLLFLPATGIPEKEFLVFPDLTITVYRPLRGEL